MDIKERIEKAKERLEAAKNANTAGSRTGTG